LYNGLELNEYLVKAKLLSGHPAHNFLFEVKEGRGSFYRPYAAEVPPLGPVAHIEPGTQR